MHQQQPAIKVKWVTLAHEGQRWEAEKGLRQAVAAQKHRLTRPTLVPMNRTKKKHAVMGARSFSGRAFSIAANGDRNKRPMPRPAIRGIDTVMNLHEVSFKRIIRPTSTTNGVRTMMVNTKKGNFEERVELTITKS